MSEHGDTPLIGFAKVVSLVTMNMRYEKIAFDMNLDEHPYCLTKRVVEAAIEQFRSLVDISFIESSNRSLAKIKSSELEVKHEELWQEIWSRHSDDEFQEFINLKRRRLEINGLVKYVKGKHCADFGCGNGAFSFALLEAGADSVTGIDFGVKSIQYANMVAATKGLSDRARFQVDSVFDCSLPSDAFGYAVSNGVFHHLAKENIPKAISEVARVLKKDGCFWYYVDGIDAISMDLWDTSVSMLKNIDVCFIEQILCIMNVKRSKMVHIMDGLSATYLHSKFEDVIRMLSAQGFGEFKRVTGGTETDFDHNVVDSDPYGEEKFGQGDIRIHCRLLT